MCSTYHVHYSLHLDSFMQFSTFMRDSAGASDHYYTIPVRKYVSITTKTLHGDAGPIKPRDDVGLVPSLLRGASS